MTRTGLVFLSFLECQAPLWLSWEALHLPSRPPWASGVRRHWCLAPKYRPVVGGGGGADGRGGTAGRGGARGWGEGWAGGNCCLCKGRVLVTLGKMLTPEAQIGWFPT